MNTKLKKLAAQAGLEFTDNQVARVDLIDLYRFAELVRADERQGCAEDYLKIMRDAVARERQACFEFVYNYSDTYHHFGLCKRVAELMKDRSEE